jgi:hypothetical protein
MAQGKTKYRQSILGKLVGKFALVSYGGCG